MKIVEFKEVYKDYKLGKTRVKALRGISFTINKGDFLCFVGPSGSGKTTILNLIGTIDAPTKGDVILFEKYNTKLLSDKQATLLRRENIGFIFQSFNLLPVLNVYENIEFPLIIQGIKKADRKKRVQLMIEEVGLQDFINHKPEELSGGQRQRIAVARALVTNPKLVLADEPTANLDRENGLNILRIMKKLNHEFHTTFVFSTHDPKVMEQAEQIYNLEDGKLVK